MFFITVHSTCSVCNLFYPNLHTLDKGERLKGLKSQVTTCSRTCTPNSTALWKMRPPRLFNASPTSMLRGPCACSIASNSASSACCSFSATRWAGGRLRTRFPSTAAAAAAAAKADAAAAADADGDSGCDASGDDPAVVVAGLRVPERDPVREPEEEAEEEEEEAGEEMSTRVSP